MNVLPLENLYYVDDDDCWVGVNNLIMIGTEFRMNERKNTHKSVIHFAYRIHTPGSASDLYIQAGLNGRVLHIHNVKENDYG